MLNKEVSTDKVQMIKNVRNKIKDDAAHQALVQEMNCNPQKWNRVRSCPCINAKMDLSEYSLQSNEIKLL